MRIAAGTSWPRCARRSRRFRTRSRCSTAARTARRAPSPPSTSRGPRRTWPSGCEAGPERHARRASARPRPPEPRGSLDRRPLASRRRPAHPPGPRGSGRCVLDRSAGAAGFGVDADPARLPAHDDAGGHAPGPASRGLGRPQPRLSPSSVRARSHPRRAFDLDRHRGRGRDAVPVQLTSTGREPFWLPFPRLQGKETPHMNRLLAGRRSLALLAVLALLAAPAILLEPRPVRAFTLPTDIIYFDPISVPLDHTLHVHLVN